MPTTSSSRPLRRSCAAAAALVVVALSGGCSLLPGAHDAATRAGAARSAAPAASATATDSQGQAPVVGTPLPQQDLGSLMYEKNGTNVVTLTGVHRITPTLAIVTVTMHAQGSNVIQQGDFADRSLSHSQSSVPEIQKTYLLSGVRVTVPGDPTIYQTATDGADHCLCSQVANINYSGDTDSQFAYVTLPSTASTVDVMVGPVGPWTNVSVS